MRSTEQLNPFSKPLRLLELVNTFSTEPEHFRLIELLSHGATSSAAMLPTPRQVASIGTLHTVRHGSKRHRVLIASGGVMVSPADTLSAISPWTTRFAP